MPSCSQFQTLNSNLLKGENFDQAAMSSGSPPAVTYNTCCTLPESINGIQSIIPAGCSRRSIQ